MAQNSTPWYVWPFIMIWRLAGLILNIIGRKAGIIIGSVLVVLGLLQSLSIIGAFIGLPMAFFGGALLLRAIRMPKN